MSVKVEFTIDPDCEMLEIFVGDEVFFYGNFWDFNRPYDIIAILKKLGHNVEVEQKAYGEW